MTGADCEHLVVDGLGHIPDPRCISNHLKGRGYEAVDWVQHPTSFDASDYPYVAAASVFDGTNIRAKIFWDPESVQHFHSHCDDPRLRSATATSIHAFDTFRNGQFELSSSFGCSVFGTALPAPLHQYPADPDSALSGLAARQNCVSDQGDSEQRKQNGGAPC